MSKKRIAILISGRGSNLKALLEAIDQKKLDATVAVVISNKENAPGLLHAKHHGVATEILKNISTETKTETEERLVDLLKKYNVEWVVLAGYMKIVTSTLLNAYPNRVVNIHPSLLPAFPGLHAQKQALEHGVKISGCTVHLVDTGCDTGPIVLQESVPVQTNDTEDTLSAKILQKEHELFARALQLLLYTPFEIKGRSVHFK